MKARGHGVARAPGKAVAFINDVRHAPEEFVRKLWRLGFQAALSEVVVAGSTIQFLLQRAPRRRVRRARSRTGRGPACGSSTAPSSQRAPTSRWSGRTTR